MAHPVLSSDALKQWQQERINLRARSCRLAHETGQMYFMSVGPHWGS